MLTDLADAARKSGLTVIELPGWRSNASPGGEFYRGVSIHHTGSYDALTDATNDLDYAKWMAFEGRDDLDPPLMNLGLSAEGVVYVGAAGNANGVGVARATGPMPATREGNGLYIVIEAMNSGTQGWESVGKDADGNPVTQREAYHRLCAALCRHYGWSAETVRAHFETSVTGKWDPGDPDGVLYNGSRVMDMPKFRAAVARLIDNPQEDQIMPNDAKTILARLDTIEAKISDLRKKEAQRFVKQIRDLRDQGKDVDQIVAALATED